ncbi:hypothetical protein [Geodermatophilus ruber]|uniref:Uncharacterized protein n=1 Tax=Geodermatophilus ruber TaxID=504800 RepID=A0A1I3Z8M4_9ACTN|nr:hypothetical protein [Geodermatophilus ruber]SFK40051.1 hypothetical protein SAMN04488085_101401 [Geodermatophilus ruber]
MSQPDPTGYREGAISDAPDSGNLVGGVPGEDRADRGTRDTTLTTDDEAQRDEEAVRPGNEPD